MKVKNMKQLQKAEGRKLGKYLLTVELTDYDIEQFEEFGGYPTASVIQDIPSKDYKKMNVYLKNLFHNVFQTIWRKYDD